MNVKLSLLALAFTAAGASAQSAPQRSLDEVLVYDEGMNQVSDGLYAQVVGTSESYVATSAAGRNALLAKLVALRAKLSGRGDTKGDTPSGRLGFVDSLIAELGRPVPKDQSYPGNCGGPGLPLLVAATSHYGINASATASNSNGAFNTTNYAFAATYDNNDHVTSQQSSTTYGTTTASAAAAASNGSTACDSFGRASITCPGGTTPTIVAVAHTYHQGATCLQ
jgi:hypothetical protein